MRVLVRGNHRDERGATALLVAVFSVAMFVLLAFVADFGMSYVSKRQLQTAADAGALAAAVEFRDAGGSCADEAAWKSAALADASDAADDSLSANRPGATRLQFEARCEDGALVVELGAEGDTPVVFGKLATEAEHITTSRYAAARLEVGLEGGSRPWGICSAALTTSEQVTQVSAGNKSNNGCPEIAESGTWNRYACPGFAKGSTNETAQWIRDGCPSAISAIPGQPEDNPSEYLSEYCPNGKNDVSLENCLTRDTGSSLNNHKIIDAWQDQVGKTMQVPVFCGEPHCTPDAMGDEGAFPVYAMAEVLICGFNLAGNESGGWPTDGPCSDANPEDWDSGSDTVPDGSNAFYMVIKGWQGSTPDNSWDAEPELGLIRHSTD